MTTARDRIALATTVLDGDVPVPEAQRIVAAAQLARMGLEEAVAAILRTHGIDLVRARMSSRLTVLHVLAGPSTGAVARSAWSGLSRACHRHAFELPPAEPEIRSLMMLVRALTDRPDEE